VPALAVYTRHHASTTPATPTSPGWLTPAGTPTTSNAASASSRRGPRPAA